MQAGDRVIRTHALQPHARSREEGIVEWVRGDYAYVRWVGPSRRRKAHGIWHGRVAVGRLLVLTPAIAAQLAARKAADKRARSQV